MDENLNKNEYQQEKKAYEQAPPPMVDRQGNPANAYSQPAPDPQPSQGSNPGQGGPQYHQGGGYGPTYSHGQSGYSDGMTPHSGGYYHTEIRYESKGDGRAWASMILGILSLLTCCCIPCMSVIFSIAGLILGIISLKEDSGGRGMATAGIVCSGISMFMLCISLIIFVFSALNGNINYSIQAFPQFERIHPFF